MTIDFNTIVGIATILGTLAAWIALWPIAKPYIKKFTGGISRLTANEETYLLSLAKDLELKSQKNRWSDKFYIDVDTELQSRKLPYEIPPAFYVVKSINRHLKEQDFNNLSNIEKIDSSRGKTFNSLEAAIAEAQDNAVVVIAPPGGGKTVSLRNLVIKQVKKRLSQKTNLIPVFVNLGYYTGFNSDGNITNFDEFLEDFFSTSGYYSFLSNRNWENLIKQSRCIFFLDGIDELPRMPGEYEARCQKIADFVHAWPETSFILSCRELDYNRELPFQQILIKPFDRRHIKLYMEKYFTTVDFKLIFHQMEASIGILELCGNPFYLDIICYFSKFSRKIPENKTQLFDLIVNQFIERENKKQGVVVSKDDFILAISRLAYYLAVERMVTTINIDEYISSLDHDNVKFPNLIDYAIKGELLEFNEKSREVRFIHNRFQEYFSSFYILKNYRSTSAVIPQNFFTNIWWKETALFIGGLDEHVDDFINMILKHRDKFSHANKVIEKLLKLEMTLLAFECIFSNLTFNNEVLYKSIRGDLIREFRNGNALVKAKILDAFQHDKSKQISDLIQKAVNDKSLWVSERAFFMLTDGQLKMQMNFLSVLGEFLRFFIEGRIIGTFIPIIKSASKSNVVRYLLPIYLLLILASLLSIGLVAYVFYSFFNFIFFKLELAFTAECLGCLASISIGVFIIVYCLTNNNYPILKKFIYVTPLALMIHYLVFSMPNNIFYRIIMLALGWLLSSLYGRYIKKPNEPDLSIGSITAFVFGYSVLVPFLNFEAVSQTIKTYTGVSIDTNISSAPPLILLGVLVIIVIGLAIYMYRQFRALSRLNEYTNKVGGILTAHRDNSETVREFHQMFNNLSLVWAQKLLLKKIMERMTTQLQLSREQKISFLALLANATTSVHFRDVVYQNLEEEEKNFRRSIQLDIPSKKGKKDMPYSQVFTSIKSERVRPLPQKKPPSQTTAYRMFEFADNFNLSNAVIIAMGGFALASLLAESDWLLYLPFFDTSVVYLEIGRIVYYLIYGFAARLAGTTVGYVLSKLITSPKIDDSPLINGWIIGWIASMLLWIWIPNEISGFTTMIVINLVEAVVVAWTVRIVVKKYVIGLDAKIFMYWVFSYVVVIIFFLVVPSTDNLTLYILTNVIGNSIVGGLGCYLTLREIQKSI